MNSPQPFGFKLPLVLVCALDSVIVAAFACLLVYSTNVSIAQAVLYGGGAFAVSMTLGLATLSALDLL